MEPGAYSILSKKDYFKLYYQLNKENKLLASKDYYENHREYYRDYREINIEHIIAYRKQYNIDNRERILEKQREKRPCPKCSKIVNWHNISRHYKSKKCMNFKPHINI